MTEVADYRPAELGIKPLVRALSRWRRERSVDIAVSAPDGSLGFGELSAAVAALVRTLAAENVGLGTRVGLCTGRSRLSTAALLAVWWVGATAVLLDERHPADRLNFILRDAGITVLLADRPSSSVVPARVSVIRPGGVAATPGQPGDPCSPRLDECAYLVYTSGTTGWPKGVEITYGGLGTFLDALSGLRLTPGGMGINAVSPAFDGWLWCALLYLLHGQGMGTVDLSIESANGAGSSAGLAERIAAFAPRTVCMTPTLLSALERVPDAEVIVIAGEPCPARLLGRIPATSRVLNVYGPTETTIAATWSDSGRGDDPATIGRALRGYHAYVLDAIRRPVPEETTGELFVGGSAVARGYRNRPRLTAERFVPDPFVGGGARMYRTGDLVRVRADGQMQFCGRTDEQVQVRGFRVEYGELERVAMEAEEVRAAAAYVTLTGDALGVAVVPAAGADDAGCVTAVRRCCAERLPEGLRPSMVDVAEALPVLQTGKVDRAALARSGGGLTASHPPRDGRERLVCAVWNELLPHDVSDVDANFFEIGGHSLLAARAVATLRRETGLSLTIRRMLANPTVAAVAAELDRLAEEERGGA